MRRTTLTPAAHRDPAGIVAPDRTQMRRLPAPPDVEPAADRTGANATSGPSGRWSIWDCGQQVGIYATAEEAHDARHDHLERYWYWDSDHADLARDAVTITYQPAATPIARELTFG